jgi:molecular chaperone GrpE (heat shock protein)
LNKNRIVQLMPDQEYTISPEFIAYVKDNLEKGRLLDAKQRIADQKNIDSLTGLVELLYQILQRHNIQEEITSEHIKFDANHVGNIRNVQDKKLSDIIFQKI